MARSGPSSRWPRGSAAPAARLVQPAVLVVEDDRPLAEVVVEGLVRDAGMAVDVAYDGLDAADKLNLYPYDVVVLDRDLPSCTATVSAEASLARSSPAWS